MLYCNCIYGHILYIDFIIDSFPLSVFLGKGVFIVKKTIFALTAGLMCITSAPALAANNPFQDVPKDHWSYDAVTQLAADGILEGYGDGSFRGNQVLTRYEMAQVIARALAKENIPAADQNLLDKLSAEYQEELKNLGVRIGNLERNADTTRFSGYLYLREQNQLVKNKHTGKSTRSKVNRAWFDLISQSQVNKNWKVVTETNTIVDLNKDKTNNTYDLYFASMFADGTYGKFHTQLGRIDNFSQDGGIVMHNPISGGKFTFGNKLRTTLTTARVSSSNLPSLNSGESFDFGAAELAYPASKATKLYGAFYQIHDDKFKVTRGSENPNIYTLGFRSTIAKNLVLTGYYLKASDTTNKYTKDTGWFGSLEYRRIKLDQPGTWSIYTKYANIPELTQLNLDTGHFRDYKGVELGGFYVPAQNIRAHLRYYYGKNVEDTALTKSLVRSEVRIFF